MKGLDQMEIKNADAEQGAGEVPGNGLTKPLFQSPESYLNRKTATGYWIPFINLLATRHGIQFNSAKVTSGFSGTYPVFVAGRYVFKFFGFRPDARQVFESECRAHRILSQDPGILAPRLLHSGPLFEDSDSWFYTILTTVEGRSFLDLSLNCDQKKIVACDLGREIYKIHNLECNRSFTKKFSGGLDLPGAARKSVLPEHLICQIDTFMGTLDPFDEVFVNADIVENHVFLANGRLSGIIDWGDAAFTDRHYELAKLHLNVFDADKTLLYSFLNAAKWPVRKNFARQCLGMALFRQAIGLTQHHTFDVFYKLPGMIPLNEFRSLDSLAEFLFGIE